MRRLLLAVTVAVLCAPPLAAQRLWSAELGVRGGFARFKPAGTAAADQSDLLDLPGFGSGYGSLFALIPAGARVAIEPSIGFTQASIGEQSFGIFFSTSSVDLGLRGDYAVTANVFLALGGELVYTESSGQHDIQLGLQAAVGYRTPLSARLAARIEGQVTALARGGSANLQPANVYALLLGVSARTGGADVRPPSLGGWTPAIGVAAGYSRAHLVGDIAPGFPGVVDVTLLSLPGTPAAASFPAPPTMFVVVPLTGRLALEPGFDLHRTQISDTTTFTGTLAARLDVAFGAHWYAATGPVMQVVKNTGSSAFGIAGLGVAWGSRFHLTGDLDGRVELGYTMFKERGGFPLATNVLGVTVGAMMPLR